jgi:hypothetical protein
LEFHSPKPMSIGQVCVKTSKGYHVKSIVSYERFGNVLDAVFSLAVYVSFFFFLEFSLIRDLNWSITLSWVVAGGEVRDKQGHSKRFRVPAAVMIQVPAAVIQMKMAKTSV